MKATRIGDLRHRVTLEAPLRTPDGGGGSALVWVPVAELWAAIRPVSGGETVLAEQISGRVTHVILVRRHDAVEPAMRFTLGTRIFLIAAVLDVDERHRLLRCLATEELL